MTGAWDPSIPSHKALAHEIEFDNSIPEIRPLRLSRQPQNRRLRDRAWRGRADVLPAGGWYPEGPDILGLLDGLADELEWEAG